MGLETGTYINSLVSTNPLGSDERSKGDDHIRLVKSTIKASFPDVDEAVVTIHNGTSAPSNKQTGTVWRDTTNSKIKMWNGSAWIILAIDFNVSNQVDVDAGTIDGITLGTNSAVTDARIDNIKIDGNEVSVTDSNGDLTLTPNGTGDLILDGQKWPQADGSNTNYLTTNGSGQIAWTTNTVPASEANALTYKNAAETAKTAAETAKTAAETAKTASEAAQTAAETALDTFDDRFLGAKASDPAVDNDGNALVDGAMFFETTNNYMKVYDLGTTTWYQLTNTTTNQNHINTVSGSIANVNTTATNIADVNNFASVYRIASADPTTSLTTGDMVFNTTTSKTRVYTGSAWQDVSPTSAGVTAGFSIAMSIAL